jgi:predicted nucleotidyltransferase
MIKFERLPANILSNIKKLKKVLAQDSNVIFAYLFGGLSKGRVAPLSDIDIAVYLDNIEGLAEYKLDLFNRLADALGTGELDLVTLNTAPISLAGRVLRNKQLIVDKNPFRRHKYESITLREFFDFNIKEDNLFSLRYGIGR